MFGPTRAPEIDRTGLHWFNVAEPLSLVELRGKVVVLDFWTTCCINCIQVLPTLRRLEEAFPQDVAVIGVHSPKFRAEEDPAMVRQAIARYDIRHPVVHDPRRVLWDEYAVRAWPTLVVIDPDGRIVGQISGEPDPDRLLEGFGDLIRTLSERGELRPAPQPLALPAPATGPLRHPGKIRPLPVAMAGTERHWAIADGGHHQIVVVDDAGQEITRYGRGEPGLTDGPAHRARFNSPQGVTADAAALYVADTGNHAVRRIDRVTGLVTTVAGTGKRGMPLSLHPREGERTALASPWDVEVHRGHLFIANAGTHQILTLDLGRGQIRALAGTGGENIVDGPGEEALLAQPSGLCLDADASLLYVADSETSAIRVVRLADGRTETLIGTGLFDFGHRDGPFATARLQHPLGVCRIGERLIVADSYNHTLRVLDLAERQITTLDLAGLHCDDAVCLPAAEPAGVWPTGDGRLLVSDTNNHRILELDLGRLTTRTWFG